MPKSLRLTISLGIASLADLEVPLSSLKEFTINNRLVLAWQGQHAVMNIANVGRVPEQHRDATSRPLFSLASMISPIR
jgi:hypothetical protein